MAESPSTPRRRPGRPSKGARREIYGVVPAEHAEVYEAERQQLGLDWTDWVAYKLAVASGLELPDYLRNVVPLRRGDAQEGGALAV